VGANVTHEINFAESINFRRRKRSAPFNNSFYDFSILGILIQELARALLRAARITTRRMQSLAIAAAASRRCSKVAFGPQLLPHFAADHLGNPTNDIADDPRLGRHSQVSYSELFSSLASTSAITCAIASRRCSNVAAVPTRTRASWTICSLRGFDARCFFDLGPMLGLRGMNQSLIPPTQLTRTIDALSQRLSPAPEPVTGSGLDPPGSEPGGIRARQPQQPPHRVLHRSADAASGIGSKRRASCSIKAACRQQ
jgi:hypothetical protein